VVNRTPFVDAVRVVASTVVNWLVHAAFAALAAADSLLFVPVSWRVELPIMVDHANELRRVAIVVYRSFFLLYSSSVETLILSVKQEVKMYYGLRGSAAAVSVTTAEYMTVDDLNKFV
jgi:hypothetical protein